jgi:glycerol-3-phosphate dehydrogenase
MADFDLVVIGGGITGTGIARDAAGRGVRTLLVEQNDLASGASSASTGLIHVGPRDLGLRAFGQLRQARAECDVLLRTAPHLVRPLRLILPHHEGLRAAWQWQLGLLLSDRFRPAFLPAARAINLTYGEAGVPLRRRFRLGMEVSACQVDDRRLVVVSAVGAAGRGATIRTHTRLVRADRDGRLWRLVLNARGRRETVTAWALVNASGPWAAEVLELVVRRPSPLRTRFLKGTHIVVPRLFDHDRGYMFQNRDGRVLYALPYERDFTLVGPTELMVDGHPDAVAASPEEITYLCRAASVHFRAPVEPQHVVHAFTGMRPLHRDPSGARATWRRDHRLVLDAPARQAPLLTVFGGAIGTYRRIAEAVLAALSSTLPSGRSWTRSWTWSWTRSWTATTPLPGGDFPFGGGDALMQRARGLWPFLDEAHLRRLIAAYGTGLDQVLGGADSLAGLGPGFGAALTAAEVRYLMRHEWAHSAEDVLWRRSKLGLRLSPQEEAALVRFMAGDGRLEAAAE